MARPGRQIFARLHRRANGGLAAGERSQADVERTPQNPRPATGIPPAAGAPQAFHFRAFQRPACEPPRRSIKFLYPPHLLSSASASASPRPSWPTPETLRTLAGRGRSSSGARSSRPLRRQTRPPADAAARRRNGDETPPNCPRAAPLAVAFVRPGATASSSLRLRLSVGPRCSPSAR